MHIDILIISSVSKHLKYHFAGLPLSFKSVYTL